MLRQRLRGRFKIQKRESSTRIKKGKKRHDATYWRTPSSRAIDADSWAVFHRPARLSRDGHAAGGAHGPVVQGLHGRDANPAAADFSDGKSRHHATLGVGLGRD